MNITFRDSNGKLYSKNIVDIELDMEITKNSNNKYIIILNSSYTYSEEFDTVDDAEDALKALSDAKNKLENTIETMI